MRYLLLFLPLLLAACPDNVQTRGYLKEADWKDHIVVGTSTRDEVREALGSPSAQSTFGPEVWYYISTTRDTFAFFAPEVTAEDVTRVSFDEQGKVAEIKQYSLADAKDITIADRQTPTEGHEMTFMEQMFGNLGRFNAPGTMPGSHGPLPGQGGPGGR